MALQPFQKLIEKRDGFEIIRDQIAALLVFERDNQKVLAVADGKDPADWDFKVYTERSVPWENAMGDNPSADDMLPIVNIWYDSDSFAASSSTIAETQKCNGTYNIDVIGFGVSEDDVSGHKPGDELAAFDRDRAVRLVRNILMSSSNSYLQLPRGSAWDRKIESRQAYQPRLDQQTGVQVVAMRMRFNVSFNETSPQFEGVPLEELTMAVIRAEDGSILLDLTYDYT